MSNWQNALSELITDPYELCQLVEINPDVLGVSKLALQQFPLRVSKSYVARMQKGNARDPLLLQVLPIAQELESSPGFNRDPLNEKAFNPLPGLLHKYQGRVLFTLTGACAINCRYCFRRHFPYGENIPDKVGWQRIIDYILADSSIEEIIFSGGDPLILHDEHLQQLIIKFEQIPHLKRLRIHTRLPLIIPERVTEALIQNLTSTRLHTVFVIHCNHPQEIDAAVMRAMHLMRDTRILLLNQSVLLRGINDDVQVLKNLSEELFTMKVLPYYLHLLDPVAGAAHFQVEETRAKKIMHELSQCLPGYLVPKLVREDEGAPAKTVII